MSWEVCRPSDIGQIEWGCLPSPITLRLLSRYLNRTLKPMPADLRALYPKLIHLMLDTVFVVDRENQIAFVSDVCEVLLVYRAEELRLLPIAALNPTVRLWPIAAGQGQLFQLSTGFAQGGVGLYPDVVQGSSFAIFMPCVQNTSRLDHHQFCFTFSSRSMLNATGYHIEFTGIHINAAFRQVDAQGAFQDKKCFVGLRM